MKTKKKKLQNSLILGISFLSLIFLPASCGILHIYNQKSNYQKANYQKTKDELKTLANEELETFADKISKIDSSDKSELFFQSLEVDEAHPLTGTNNFKEVFGIKMIVPKGIKVEITKNLFSKALNVRVRNENIAKDLQLKIKNFAPDTEYEKKLRRVIDEVKSINSTDYDKNIFRMRWLKEGDATFNAVKTKFSDYEEDTPIGDELKTLAKNSLGIKIKPSLINALENIKGRQRFIIEKDFNTFDIKTTLVFTPSDVEFLFNRKNKVPGGANDYYRIRVTPRINTFANNFVVDKSAVFKKMLEYNQKNIWSGLLDDDYKKLVLNNNSIDEVETDKYGKLVFNTEEFTKTIKDYLITNKLQLKISKGANTNLTKFDIITDTGEKNSISFNVYGQFSTFRQYFISSNQHHKIWKNGKVIDTETHDLLRNLADFYLNNDARVIYLFGIGGVAIGISMETGLSPTNEVKYLQWFDAISTKLQYYIYGFQQGNKKSKFFVSGNSPNGENYPRTLTTLMDGNGFDVGGEYTNFTPEVAPGAKGVKFVSHFFLPIPNDKRNFHAIMKVENRDRTKPKPNAGKWCVTKFDSYGDRDRTWPFQAYYNPVYPLENVHENVGDALLRTNDPSDGYIFRLTDDKNTKVRFYVDYEDGKNLKLINDSSKWNSVDTEFKWPSVKLVKAADGGFWLAGKNGEIVYIDKDGNVDKKNMLVNVKKELTSVVEDSKGNGAFAVGKNGYIAHVTKNASGILTLDWEKNIFRNQTILDIKRDDEGSLYLVGNVPGGGVKIEKLSPDGLRYPWDNKS